MRLIQCKPLIVFVALCMVGGVNSAEVGLRSYELPDHGELQLNVPTSWQDKLRQPPNRLPPTIAFHPSNGTPFEILVTPIWPIGDSSPASTPQAMQKGVRAAADAAKTQSVEETIDLKELKGSSGTGYYFSATDKAPKAGEYKFMTQGMVRVGELTVTFTILTNEGQGDIIESALAMIAAATQSKETAT